MEKIFSVRMRAAQNGPHEKGGKHISGGEKLSTYNHLKESIEALVEKALFHSRGKPDFMQIQLEQILEPIKRLNPLPVSTIEVSNTSEGQAAAKKLLEKAGVPVACINKAFEELTQYSDMRGAMLFDIHTCSRMDERKERGVRVSRMDWITANYIKWAQHYNMPQSERVKEALVLATKVSAHPATIAELCWSDDPEYITGYVASKTNGYQRITKLKELGDERGCRIFFISGINYDVRSYIDYLEKQPIFVHWEKPHETVCMGGKECGA